MAKYGGGSIEWMSESECAKLEYRGKEDIFFSHRPAEVHEAKNVCYSCPVRDMCLKWALENKEIWGTWGGRDEFEIRKTLSVNADGVEVRLKRFPVCPYCSANTSKLQSKIVEKPGGGRWTTMRVVECTDCGFEWRSRTSANAVNAYFAEKASKSTKKKAVVSEQPPLFEIPKDVQE